MHPKSVDNKRPRFAGKGGAGGADRTGGTAVGRAIDAVAGRIRLHKWAERLFRLSMYMLLFGLAFVFLFPFLYMIVTSFKTNADLHDFTVNWVPTVLKYENYAIAFRALGYIDFAKNSFLLTAVATAGHLLSCSFIGYGFARYAFPLKKTLFLLVIFAFIVPIQTLIVPMYTIFVNLGWIQTYLPILVPAFFGFGLNGALFIFIFRQFYVGIPRELENAAKIDGCGFLRTYWFIVLPVARPVFLVVLVLSMVWHWNDFYAPAIYAPRPEMATLPARLNVIVSMVDAPPETLFGGLTTADEAEKSVNNAVLMAGSFMVIAPVMLGFALLQRKFMQGIERTGLTGE